MINDLLDPTGQNLRVREDAQVFCLSIKNIYLSSLSCSCSLTKGVQMDDIALNCFQNWTTDNFVSMFLYMIKLALRYLACKLKNFLKCQLLYPELFYFILYLG